MISKDIAVTETKPALTFWVGFDHEGHPVRICKSEEDADRFYEIEICKEGHIDRVIQLQDILPALRAFDELIKSVVEKTGGPLPWPALTEGEIALATLKHLLEK